MLTVKQQNFCKSIVSGMTVKDSYLSAYDCHCNDNTANREGTRLLAREDIKEFIKELQKPLINHTQATIISEREKKKKIIWERIQVCTDKGDDASVARYMDILNKMDAEYVQISKDITERPPLDNIDTDTLLKLA